MAPLRCLTYGLIAVRHLANQKRVKQARDQRSVTQRMRRKVAGIFCFVVLCFFKSHGPIMALVFFLHGDWRTQTKIKFSSRRFFWCFFQGCSRPKAEPQSKEKTIGVGSLGLLLTLFSLKTLKNGVLRTILFRPNNIKISILIFHGCQIG